MVADVAERHTGVGVVEAQRAAGPEMAERAGIRAQRPLDLGQLEAQAKPGWAAEHPILAIDLLADRRGDDRRSQDRPPPPRRPAGQGAIDLGDAVRRAMAVGRWNFS